MSQCLCSTKSGTQCSRNAKKGSVYCYQHQDCDKPFTQPKQAVSKKETQLDYKILQKVYGKDLANALRYLGVTSIFDVNDWIERQKSRGDSHVSYPSIGSIFEHGHGSSTYHDKKYGTIGTINGTLAGIGAFEEFPFGEEYYEAKYGQSLIMPGDLD